MKRSTYSYYTPQYFAERDLLDIHLATTIRMLLQENQAHKVLDVGCGTGRLVKYLKDHDFTAYGCDVSRLGIQAARKINALPSQVIFKASATHLPFNRQTLDAVLAISVIEHLSPKQGQQFLRESARVLKPGGLFFLVTPNFAAPWRKLQGKKWFGYSDPTHITFYTPAQLSRLIKLFGFVQVRFWFKTPYSPPYAWELPGLLTRLPRGLKIILTYLLISTPLTFVRNNFWLAAKKHESK